MGKHSREYRNKSAEDATVAPIAEVAVEAEAAVADSQAEATPAVEAAEPDFGFSIDAGRAGKATIDLAKLEAVLEDAKKAMEALTEKAKREITSVSMPLATFNKRMGLSGHNAHSLAYRLEERAATAAVLAKFNMRLGRRGKYDAAIEKQAIAFILKPAVAEAKK